MSTTIGYFTTKAGDRIEIEAQGITGRLTFYRWHSNTITEIFSLDQEQSERMLHSILTGFEHNGWVE